MLVQGIKFYCDEYLTLDIEGDVDFKASATSIPIEDEYFIFSNA